MVFGTGQVGRALSAHLAGLALPVRVVSRRRPADLPEGVELLAEEVGHPVGVRSLPKLALRALGLFNPTTRALIEMTYELDEPFVLDTTRYESTFGTAGTPLCHCHRRNRRRLPGSHQTRFAVAFEQSAIGSAASGAPFPADWPIEGRRVQLS